MAIVYDRLINLNIPTVEQTYTEKDTMLYALGIGAGFDPTGKAELAFCYEKGLQAMPMQAWFSRAPACGRATSTRASTT